MTQLKVKKVRKRHIPCVFVCFCCTTHNVDNSLKQQLLFSLEFSRSEVEAQNGWVLCSGLKGQNQGVNWVESNLKAEEEAISKLNQLVSKIQFLEVKGLRFLFPGWLSATNCSQLLNDDHLPCHIAPLPSKPAMENVTHVDSLLYAKSLSLGRAPYFLRSQLIWSGPLNIIPLF